jgi:hypothetical protein
MIRRTNSDDWPRCLSFAECNARHPRCKPPQFQRRTMLTCCQQKTEPDRAAKRIHLLPPRRILRPSMVTEMNCRGSGMAHAIMLSLSTPAGPCHGDSGQRTWESHTHTHPASSRLRILQTRAAHYAPLNRLHHAPQPTGKLPFGC